MSVAAGSDYDDPTEEELKAAEKDVKNRLSFEEKDEIENLWRFLLPENEIDWKEINSLVTEHGKDVFILGLYKLKEQKDSQGGRGSGKSRKSRKSRKSKRSRKSRKPRRSRKSRKLKRSKSILEFESESIDSKDIDGNHVLQYVKKKGNNTNNKFLKWVRMQEPEKYEKYCKAFLSNKDIETFLKKKHIL